VRRVLEKRGRLDMERGRHVHLDKAQESCGHLELMDEGLVRREPVRRDLEQASYDHCPLDHRDLSFEVGYRVGDLDDPVEVDRLDEA
jgi:hypothetical protein